MIKRKETALKVATFRISSEKLKKARKALKKRGLTLSAYLRSKVEEVTTLEPEVSTGGTEASGGSDALGRVLPTNE